MLSDVIQREISDYYWNISHGVVENISSLGNGFLYYFLTYNAKAKVCVCVGSGGGFVPALMRQAQIDHMIENSKTILIDGNVTAPHLKREFSHVHDDFEEVPRWLNNPDYTFNRRYIALIETIIKKSDDAVSDITDPIDYLHLDGDHSYNQVKRDFHNYTPLVRDGGFVTMHDINLGIPDSQAGVRRFLDELKLQQPRKYDIFYFEASEWGDDQGTALIKIK